MIRIAVKGWQYTLPILGVVFEALVSNWSFNFLSVWGICLPAVSSHTGGRSSVMECALASAEPRNRK